MSTETTPDAGLSAEQRETVVETPVTDTLESLTENEPKKSDTVSLKKYMEEKGARKEAETKAEALASEIQKLRSNIPEMSVAGVNDAVKALAGKHNIDENFLGELVTTVQSATESSVRAKLEEEYAPKLSRLEEDRNADKVEKKFDTLFNKALDSMPEYDGIVNKDVIKALAFDPKNAKKTMAEIVEDAYGNAIKGKRTIESGRSSRDPQPINAKTPSPDDWDRIESDPTARAEWSKTTEDTIRRYL